MALGIFAIMCPGCGTPVDDDASAECVPADELAVDAPADVRVCAGCASAFVVRFGHALALGRATGQGVR